MGGLMILSGIIVSTLLWGNLANAYVWIVLFVTVGFGAIGFYDDYLKVTKQSHKGFSGRSRLAIEAAIAGVACLAIVYVSRGALPPAREFLATSIAIPFFKELKPSGPFRQTTRAPQMAFHPVRCSIGSASLNGF